MLCRWWCCCCQRFFAFASTFFGVIREFTIKIIPSIYLSKIPTKEDTSEKKRKVLEQENTTRFRPEITIWDKKKYLGKKRQLYLIVLYTCRIDGSELHGFFASLHLTIFISVVSLMTVFKLNFDHNIHFVKVPIKLTGNSENFFRSAFSVFLLQCGLFRWLSFFAWMS